MIDPQQKVLLEVTPIELWILYHRVNQSYQSFWHGLDGDHHYADGQAEIAEDANDYQNVKHDLWEKIDTLMIKIGMKAQTTISSQIGTPIRVNDHEVEFDNDGDVSVGCEDVSYEILKQIYEKATKLRKE